MYGSEQAEVYELVHAARGKDYRAETQDLARRIRRLVPDADALLDVACGTGAHLACFAESFGRVVGLELSEPMAEAARRRLPGVPVHVGDMRSFRLVDQFDAITCMFGSIGYCTDTAELVGTAQRFAAHLRPGGVVAIDPWWFAETFADGYVAGAVVTVGERTVARVSHSAREDAAGQVPVCRMTVHYVVADPAGGARHFAETHRLSLFSRAQYEAALAGAGFDIEFVAGAPAGRGLFVAQMMRTSGM